MHGLQGNFVILYSGNFGQTHNIDSILDAAEKLKQYQNIKFVFIGDGYKKRLIENRIKYSNLDNTILLPFQDKSIFPHSITSGDISIVTLDARASEVSIPSKLFYYMAAGNAIISLAANNSELARLVEKYNVGVNIDEDKLNTLSCEILRLYQNREQCDLFSINSRKASLNHTQKNVNLFTLE
jgi:glycosyltransferase involved in cell wall biosynthesis